MSTLAFSGVVTRVSNGSVDVRPVGDPTLAGVDRITIVTHGTPDTSVYPIEGTVAVSIEMTPPVVGDPIPAATITDGEAANTISASPAPLLAAADTSTSTSTLPVGDGSQLTPADTAAPSTTDTIRKR